MTIVTTDIALAAHALRRGELVAFATETVYGLGADATNGQAVAAIYEAKGRPSHCASHGTEKGDKKWNGHINTIVVVSGSIAEPFQQR